MTPRRAAWLAAGAVVVVVALVVAATVWRSSGGGSVGTSVTRDVTAAGAPFGSLTAGVVRVGDQRLEVVIADDASERNAGLRGRVDASPYDGMLFVFPSDSTAAFTMAGVPAPLEIAFYAADGTRVDRLLMEPCAGTDATCPVYRSSAEYRYALETAPGRVPRGPLAVRRAPRVRVAPLA